MPAGPLRWSTAPVRRGGEGKDTERAAGGGDASREAARPSTAFQGSAPVGESLCREALVLELLLCAQCAAAVWRRPFSAVRAKQTEVSTVWLDGTTHCLYHEVVSQAGRWLLTAPEHVRAQTDDRWRCSVT